MPMTNESLVLYFCSSVQLGQHAKIQHFHLKLLTHCVNGEHFGAAIIDSCLHTEMQVKRTVVINFVDRFAKDGKCRSRTGSTEVADPKFEAGVAAA